MRVRSDTWLWLLVAVQVAIPASYYLRADRDDERFAWRMFSSVRMRRCEVSAFEVQADGSRAQVALNRELHASWVRSLERGRANVIDRFLATRCTAGVREGVLERRCREPSGTDMPSFVYRHPCEGM